MLWLEAGVSIMFISDTDLEFTYDRKYGVNIIDSSICWRLK